MKSRKESRLEKELTQNTFNEGLLTKDARLQAEFRCRGPPYDWNF